MQHKENGVVYSLDVTKCMFSSGNVTERGRMGDLDCSGETIVDLYAGIGYYTLPLLCKAKAAMVCQCLQQVYLTEIINYQCMQRRIVFTLFLCAQHCFYLASDYNWI